MHDFDDTWHHSWMLSLFLLDFSPLVDGDKEMMHDYDDTWHHSLMLSLFLLNY